MGRPVLYDYHRSSAAYRVRIALNLKGVDYESRQIDLRDGAQRSDAYLALNPQGLVPMMEIDGHRLTQSLAILNYLDMRYPNQPLIPASAAERAHVVAMALTIACDIHPLNNLRVLKYLKHELGHSQEEVGRWYAHWISEGLPAL
jgi:maleylacetoacetate isomerase